MNKFCLLAWIGLSLIAHGKELGTYSEVASAVTQGNPIRMVVRVGDGFPAFCTEPTSVMLRAAYLQFADNHLTTNHPGFEKTAVLENVTYRISDGGEVRITTRVLKMPEYQVLGEHTYVSTLGESAKVFTPD